MGAPRPVELISALVRRRTTRPPLSRSSPSPEAAMAASGHFYAFRTAPRRLGTCDGPRRQRVISSSRPRPAIGDPVICRSGGSTECPSPPGDRVLTGSASPSPPGTTKWRGASPVRRPSEWVVPNGWLARGRQVSRESGAGDGVRTRDIQLGKLTLCQLSYSRKGRRLPLKRAFSNRAGGPEGAAGSMRTRG
jgi:hypothetical protein